MNYGWLITNITELSYLRKEVDDSQLATTLFQSICFHFPGKTPHFSGFLVHFQLEMGHFPGFLYRFPGETMRFSGFLSHFQLENPICYQHRVISPEK